MKLVVLVALLLGRGDGAADKPSCEQRCAASVKGCTQTCDGNFPKEQLEGCRKACVNSVAPCQQRCKGGTK
jgi:hypothetical protein